MIAATVLLLAVCLTLVCSPFWWIVRTFYREIAP